MGQNRTARTLQGGDEMSDMIDDNRFVLIEKYKRKLIEGTNIESRPEEMEVLDSILFRFWQMGWLDKLEEESKWIPCSERLPEAKQKVLVQYADESMATKRCNDAGHLAWFYSNAVAWMPALKPFKGVTE